MGLDLQYVPYTSHVVLTDGGVYDNLGLETVWKQCRTVLISYGGGATGPTPRPNSNWFRQVNRVLMGDRQSSRFYAQAAGDRRVHLRKPARHVLGDRQPYRRLQRDKLPAGAEQSYVQTCSRCHTTKATRRDHARDGDQLGLRGLRCCREAARRPVVAVAVNISISGSRSWVAEKCVK